MSLEQLRWFKSSYSDGEGGACVEVAVEWRKSSYSSGEGGECVEIATCPTTIHIRDSKNPGGPQLACAPASWTAFVSYAQERLTHD
ncbi:DUF397 domain-containing protein [Streptomyces formicae]|uniref:DUF397 domain-containing protein n=1 Tax=Streptomyces formicae TaxID=1616117 RepID=A0ABY3WSZ1_9ACTN|nr:DUF397 domain-containing protein [Streptomyces formicae]UNM15721.1 DUF397 domain-containing protein [Streptomyces formicae]